MSDYDINKMDFKQLRNEVQLLRDELAIMKRKYEDIIYNLDTDNFSQRIVKQGKDMYTKIEQTAEEITLQAEKVEENSKNIASLEITADEIQSEVFEETEDGTKVSRITQNAESITSEVENRKSADTQLSSEITQTANSIISVVEANYNDLSGSISTVSQEANKISTRVRSIENGQFGNYTLFEQTDDTFLFDGDYMRISAAIILTDNKGKNAFSIFHNTGGDTTPGVYMWGQGDYSYSPLIIGQSAAGGEKQNVYLYGPQENNLVATRGWVEDYVSQNGGGGGTVTAVFA